MEKEKTLNRKKIYSGRILNFEVCDVLCPNGVKSLRELVHHPGGVCILVEIDNKIFLEKQYRYPYDDFLYELPAGKLEKGEDPYFAALRELEEEVGYKAKELISYGEIYPTVAYTDEVIHLYVAKNLSKSKQHLDVDENFSLSLYSKDEILEMIKNNTIKDAKSLILLLRYLNNI